MLAQNLEKTMTTLYSDDIFCVLHVHRVMLLAAASQALAAILEKLGLR
jgi:hypothetical protein